MSEYELNNIMYVRYGDKHLKSKHFSFLSDFHSYSKSLQSIQHSVVNLKFINLQMLRTQEMWMCRSVSVKRWKH